MPRRRSRSRKKNSGDNKDLPKSPITDQEDDPDATKSEISEHHSRKEINCSLDKLVPKLSYIYESQEKCGVNDSEDLTKQPSKLHDQFYSETTTDNEVEIRCSSSDSISNPKQQTETSQDKFQEAQNEDLDRLKSASCVSKGKQVFKERNEVFEEPQGTIVSNTIESNMDKEDSSEASTTNEPFLTDENLKCVSYENMHNKNSQNPTEPLRNNCSNEEEAKESNFYQNKHLSEVILQGKTAITVDIPPEGTDDATRSNSISEDKNQTLTRRQRRMARSKDRGDVQSMSAEVFNKAYRKEGNTEGNEENSKDFVEELEYKEVQNFPEILSDCKVKDNAITKRISPDRKSFPTTSEENSENEFETKMSVLEIKRKFSCHSGKSNETVKLRNTSASLEMEDSKEQSTLHPSKDIVSGGNSGVCTTELYISTVGGKESSSASFLSAAESNSSFLVEEKSARCKPKNLGFSNDSENARGTSEGTTELASSEISKLSIKQLKERLISSCSDILDKPVETKHHEEVKRIEKCISYDETAELQPNTSEKDDFSVSVRERMETYKCQASKAYHNIQSFYIEQELPSVTSIKELQSSFNKSSQPSVSPVNNVSRSKVKSINEDLAQMQSFSMKCKSCGRQVFFMERVMAEKAMWHKKCFRCKECQKQLTVENYKSQDGELYCQSHYMNTLKPKPTDETISESSVVEEVRIPLLNLKPLFEKTHNTSPPNSPPISPLSVERSPTFLKKLAKFEGKYQGEIEDEEHDKENTSEDSKNNSPGRKSIADDLESFLQEESRKKPANNEASSRKKISSNGSPKSSNLHEHMKHFFEKSPDDPENAHTNKNIEDISDKSNHIFESRASLGVRDMEDGLLWSTDRAINWQILNPDQTEGNEYKTSENVRTCASVIRETSDNIKYKSMRNRLPSDPEQDVERSKEIKISFSNPNYNVTVNGLKECLNTYPKTGSKTSDDKRVLERNNSDGCIEKIIRKREIEDFKLSLKEKLESYKTQASKKTRNIQIFEDKYYPRTSIKELKSSFNRSFQSCCNSVELTKKTKINQKHNVFETQDTSINCKACGKKVFFMERILAANAVWHKKCFRCKVCNKQLSVENYKSQNGELYCQLHYKMQIPSVKYESVLGHKIYEMEFSTTVSNPFREKSKKGYSEASWLSNPPIEKSSEFVKRLAIFDNKYRIEHSEKTKNIDDQTVDEIHSDIINFNVNDIENSSNNEGASINIIHKAGPNTSSSSSLMYFHVEDTTSKSLNDLENNSAQKILEDSNIVTGDQNRTL